MKIKNPLDKTLKLRFKGTDYTLESGISKAFPEDVIAQWITIYGFLSIVSGTDKETDAVVEEVQKAKKVAKKKATKKEDNDSEESDK